MNVSIYIKFIASFLPSHVNTSFYDIFFCEEEKKKNVNLEENFS